MGQKEIFLNKLYSYDPHGTIATGDIFDMLPTMGLLKEEFTQGIIITPSCDLANSKTDTITYLPIIPIHSYLCSGKGYSLIKSEIINLSKALNLDTSLFNSRQIPSEEDVELYLSQFDSKPKFQGKDIGRKAKLDACLNLVKNIRNVNLNKLNSFDLNAVWSGQFDKLITGLIQNSISAEVHFLPREKVVKDECVILREHSVVLFRYPITVHSEILIRAKDTNQENMASWTAYIDSLKAASCTKVFTKIPLRGLRLQQDFLSDVLTRYVSLYIRIGSPDFSDFHIEEMQVEIINELK